jgi:DNA polymerase I-like protein with 3'-5' exonuclease and polymerase domains
MKVLINYDPEEKGYLGTLNGLLKERGHTCLASHNTIEIRHLSGLKEKSGIDAIVMCKEESLKNLVQASTSASVTLDAFRGSVLQYNPSIVVVNSLTHIRTVRHGKWLLGKDLDKLSRIGEPIEIPTFKVIETEQDAFEAVFTLNKAEIISIDIETDDTPRITCISFTGLFNEGGIWKTRSYMIPFWDFGVPHWNTDNGWRVALSCMRNICKNEVPKMMYNAPYDASYLLMYGAEPNNLVLDTMGLMHSLYCELPKSLDFTCSIFDPHYMQWKTEAALAKKNKDIRAYWMYCVKDSFNTLRAAMIMLAEYPEYAFKNYNIQFKFTFPCLYMAFEGVKIDEDAKKKAAEGAKERFTKMLSELRIMAADPSFNPGSPKQVAELIYKTIGAREVKGQKTDNKTLNTVAEQHPILAALCTRIIDYRKETKAHSTYFTFKEINGRLLYQLGPFATDTVRFSSRASNLYVGTQIQNIPEYAKGMMIADDGYKLIELDNSKSEARIVAYFANCQALIDALEDPEKDFYKLLATIFFGMAYEDVTPFMRNKVMKRIIHGKNYQMQEDTFIEVATAKALIEGARILRYKMTTLKAFAKYLLNIYDVKFSEVKKHYEEIREEVKSSGRIVSILGYTRVVFGDINDPAILRSIVAHEPQNLSVHILGIGLWKIYTQMVLPSGGAVRLKAQIHDSNFAQIKDDEKFEERAEQMRQLMLNPVTIKGRQLLIPVERKDGYRWLPEE